MKLLFTLIAGFLLGNFIGINQMMEEHNSPQPPYGCDCSVPLCGGGGYPHPNDGLNGTWPPEPPG